MSALLMPNEIVSMSAQAARLLVQSGNGDCALLYLALLGGDVDSARKNLHWEDARLNGAYSRLTDLGLVAPESAPAPKENDPAADLPEYSRKDIADALSGEPEFKGLYLEIERLWGFPLSDADLKSLYTVYDGLALPSEVVLLLAGYVQRSVRRQKQNVSARPRMVQMKNEAFRWKRLGLTTVETAEEYLKRQQQVDAREWAILSAVGVSTPRPAVERERQYINDWVAMGMSDDLITMAYERTAYKKGGMNWPYMNKILQSWHAAGWRTPEEVKAGDKPPKRALQREQGGQQSCQPSADRIKKSDEWLDRFLEEQRKDG